MPDELHEAQRRAQRDILGLSKRIDEVLDRLVERFEDGLKKGGVKPDERDRLIDDSRNEIHLLVSTYIRRHSKRAEDGSGLSVAVQSQIRSETD